MRLRGNLPDEIDKLFHILALFLAQLVVLCGIADGDNETGHTARADLADFRIVKPAENTSAEPLRCRLRGYVCGEDADVDRAVIILHHR